MRTPHSKINGFAWLIFVLFFISCMFTVSFYLTGMVFRIVKISPPALVAQILNSILGLLFSGLIVGVVGKIANARGWIPERNLFGQIIEAMEKIAKGDFGVRITNAANDNQMVSLLTNSVNKMALELEQMEILRQEFISNVSHEIQSPLTSIRGFAQALENDQLSLEEKHHYLSIIETESTRLSRITVDLLRLAALESEHAKYTPKLYWVDKQIRSLVLACEPQWSEKKLDINVELERIQITADEDLLSQVWMNLLSNSIKFTPEGGRVFIELHQQGQNIEVNIRDTGIGIAPEEQERIFERFYKVDRSRTNSNGGSGLGLAIARKIISMHAGDICVESRPGAGTTFLVKIPLSPE
jgi:two-component system, OmpR family, phosphate regulon sensor histidine kinase PhoR